MHTYLSLDLKSVFEDCIHPVGFREKCAEKQGKSKGEQPDFYL